MQLRRQLGILLVIAATGLALALGLALWAVRNITQETIQMGEAEAFIKDAAELRMIALETSLFHEERSQVQWNQKIAHLRKKVAEFGTPESAGNPIAGRIGELLDSAHRVYQRIDKIQPPELAPAATHAPQPNPTASSLQTRSIASLLVITNEITDAGYELIDQERSEMAAALRRIQAIIVAIVLLLATAIATIAVMARKRILQPLQAFHQATNRIVQGDYSGRLNFSHTDEIGQLGKAFDAMTENVHHALQEHARLNLSLSQSSVEKDAALRASEALLSTLDMHAIVSFADRSGNITEVNEAFCHISGYTREELLGQNHRIVNSGEHPEEFWVAMWCTISAGTPWRNQVCNRAKNGSLYWVDTFIAPFVGDDGRAEKYISIRTDITASKLAELALVKAKEQALEASHAKSYFLANMSHELRTPMNAILGMLALLRKTELSPRQADYASKSAGAARSLLGLLNDILDFSKIEAGKMSLDPHPFRLDELLRNLSVILSPTVGAKPIEVVFDIDPALPALLFGDQMRLQQVLINLASNAIKFTEKGFVRVTMAALQQDAQQVTLRVSVRDSGIGIAPENQARIFSAFTQAESSTTRRFGGSGLGVAISQRFVELMGGVIALESTVGVGSEFYFTVVLPCVAHAMPELLNDTASTSDLSNVDVSCRVLIVDDNPMALEVLESMVQSLGWEVDVATSGEAAIEKFDAQRRSALDYQAVFIDWQMPGLDGWQTCQRIRESQQPGAEPIVVMVTVNDREMLAQRSPSDQALLDGYLVKPVTASMLFDAISDVRALRQQPHLSQPLHTSHAGSKRLRGLRLLIAEDNLINQQVARELLEDEGALVWMANNGQEAVQALGASDAAFDLVLMDLQMPVMDGLTATRAIRQDLGLTLPIVAMTANVMASDREACAAAGMNDHIGKPFDLDNLVQVLCKHAGRAYVPPAQPAASSASPVLPEAITSAAFKAGVSIAIALERIGGKQDIYMRMLRSFVADLKTLPSQLLAPAFGNTISDSARLLHTLKGLSATLGITELSNAAAKAERVFKEDFSSHLREAEVQHLLATIAAAQSSLSDLLLCMQQAQAPVHTSAFATGSIDEVALLQDLKALCLELQNSDMGALQSLADIQLKYSAGLGERLGALEVAMSELDFEQALHESHFLVRGLDLGAAS